MLIGRKNLSTGLAVIIASAVLGTMGLCGCVKDGSVSETFEDVNVSQPAAGSGKSTSDESKKEMARIDKSSGDEKSNASKEDDITGKKNPSKNDDRSGKSNASQDDDESGKNNDSDQVYYDFLEGKIGAEFCVGNDSELKEGVEYKLDEIAEALKEDKDEDFARVNYAFIDCGKDDEQELALKFEVGTDYDYFTRYMIVTNTEGSLKIVCNVESYYRYTASVNRFGYIVSKGAGGANTELHDEAFVDADGNYVFVYARYDEYGLDRPWIDPYRIAESDRPAGYPNCEYANSDHGYTTSAYNFSDYTFTADKEQADEYIRGYFFTFYDGDFNNCEPFPEDAELFDSIGLNYYSEDEINEMIKQHKEEIGVTTEIEKGGDIIWLELDERGDEEPELEEEILCNRGYFTQVGDKLYFRLPTTNGMDNSTALWGDYFATYAGQTQILCYDMSDESSTNLFYDRGGHDLVISGNRMFVEEAVWDDEELFDSYVASFDLNDPLKNGLVRENGESILCYDKSGEYVVTRLIDYPNKDHIYVYRNGVYEHSFDLDVSMAAGIGGGKMYYTTYDEDQEIQCLYVIDLETGEELYLGEMPTNDDGWNWGNIDQFVYAGDLVYLSYGFYEGTGNFFAGAYYLCADPKVEGSLNIIDTSYADMEYTESPAFMIKSGRLQICEGLPFSADVDYDTGVLVYYDKNGKRVEVAKGFGNVNNANGTVSMTEKAEYIDGQIYVLRNDNIRYPSDDIGWREAYKRKNSYVLKVDAKTGEVTNLFDVSEE